MSLPSRNPNAPWAAGQTVPAADLEFDIAQAHSALADIDNDNIPAGADINGSKLADNTVAAAKLVAETVTQAKIASGAISATYIATDNTQQTIGAGGATDVVSTSALSIPSLDPVAVVILAWGYHSSLTGAHELIIRRDTTDLLTNPVTGATATVAGTGRMIMHVDTPTASTTPVYHFRINNTDGANGCRYHGCQILAVELRR